MIAMKPQPEPSPQEVLAGLVQRVTYHNAENGFCVLRAKVRGRRHRRCGFDVQSSENSERAWTHMHKALFS
jgi:hypothetical protein